ncbi:acyl-CoA dehydrogenase family protein [Williamsia sp. R60]
MADCASRPRPSSSKARAAAARQWQSELVDAGLAAPGWPRAVGGMELELEDQLDYYRMTTAAGVPKHPSGISFIVAPTLIVYGTQQQKDRFLEPLLRADEIWCQGFSEPGAGSDLASLTTKAARDGDNYRVTGQKIWTTQGEHADWMFALVRTGPAGRRTSGITYLLIDMKSDGIDVRPLRDASGGVHFAEVFFDDVVVPVANRVGEEGEGWSVMRTSLGHERATAFLADEFRYRGLVDKVVRLAIERGLAGDPMVRQQMAEMEAGVRVIAANSSRALEAVLRSEDPGAVASVNRLVKSEFEQRLHRLALRLTGPGAALGNRSPGAVDGGRWTYGYLMTRASTIGAGTSEIQRNTIAESVLGLPSHRGERTRKASITPGRPLTAPGEDEADLRAVLGKAISTSVNTEWLLDRAEIHDVYDIGLWDELVKFGLPGLAVAEDLGGSGADLRLLCAAVEEAAFSLAPVPLVPTVIALEVAVAARGRGVVSAICGGATAAFVVPLSDDGWSFERGRLPVLEGNRLNGGVSEVPGTPVAEHLIAVAHDGTGPAIVACNAADASVWPQNALDLTATIGTVEFDSTEVIVLASGEAARHALSTAQRIAELVLAADSVGVANRAMAMAVDWAGQREQFGHKIGSYQSISHRCADMLVASEGARSQVFAAADMAPDDPDAMLAAHLACSAALDAAVTVSESCIQIHGGIGFTWEHTAHLLLRRAISNQVLLGRPDRLRDNAAQALVSRLG